MIIVWFHIWYHSFNQYMVGDIISHLWYLSTVAASCIQIKWIWCGNIWLDIIPSVRIALHMSETEDATHLVFLNSWRSTRWCVSPTSPSISYFQISWIFPDILTYFRCTPSQMFHITTLTLEELFASRFCPWGPEKLKIWVIVCKAETRYLVISDGQCPWPWHEIALSC